MIIGEMQSDNPIYCAISIEDKNINGNKINKSCCRLGFMEIFSPDMRHMVCIVDVITYFVGLLKYCLSYKNSPYFKKNAAVWCVGASHQTNTDVVLKLPWALTV